MTDVPFKVREFLVHPDGTIFREKKDLFIYDIKLRIAKTWPKSNGDNKSFTHPDSLVPFLRDNKELFQELLHAL